MSVKREALVAVAAVLATPAAPLQQIIASQQTASQQTPGPRDVAQIAERAVQDDSAAALGLGSLARLAYDFPTAERLSGATPE